MTRPLIYVSHQSDDRSAGARLRTALERYDVTVVDRQSTEISWRAAIASCTVFLACCSAQPLNERELQLAIARAAGDKRLALIALHLHGESLPGALENFDTISLQSWDDAVPVIVSRLGLTERPPASVKPRRSVEIEVANLVAQNIETCADHTKIKVSREAVVAGTLKVNGDK